ncbi:MAG: DMT family transporter [Rhodobacteraceae bacterium]|jgi:probable blue pigment (indigoidine) exporter|nr:DMT family transporter [Paracoccaceae bacterium]
MDLRAVLMGLAFAVLWSSAFATARIIVADIPPFITLSLRFAISGSLAIGLALALGQSWRLSPRQGAAVIVFGLCQNALYLGLNFVALQWVPASVAAIIASSMPLIVAGLGWAFLREKVSALGVAGLAAGFAGVILIMGSRVHGGVDPAGVALCLAGALALAVATLAMRGASSGGNLLMIVGLQMWVGSLALLPLALSLESWPAVIGWPATLAFVYQIFMPGLTATLIWFALVARIGAIRAATFHFLNPFFGVTIAAALLGEAITPLDLAGVAIVMAGIYAVQRSRRAPAPPV